MISSALAIVASYLTGSIASAVLVCKMLGKPDPRSEGSQNPGATNVLRLHGKKAAALTLLGDALKGFLPVLLIGLWGAADLVVGLAALAAFLGHLFPVFFQFKGGKGVATFVGVLLGMHLGLGACFALVWLTLALVFRYSSLAALGAAALAPVYTLWLSPSWPLVGCNTIMAALLLWRHRPNIKKLMAGEEDRIRLGRKKEPGSSES